MPYKDRVNEMVSVMANGTGRGMTAWMCSNRTDSNLDSHQACGHWNVLYYMPQHVVAVYAQVRQR